MNHANDFVVTNGILEQYSGQGGDVVIPNGVKEIGPFVFMNNKSITSVTLSDSVEIVRYLAFSYCDNLTKVLISEKTQNIEKNAFLNSRKLADENGLVVINNVLYHCYRNADDITIPAGVTSIESEAFAECTKLQKLIIPNGVKTIGQKAFSGCENLKTVILPQGLVRIDDYAFCDCDINYISIPVGVKSFGKGFLGRSHYYEIEVPTWYSQLTEAVNGADITCIHTEDISSVPAKYRRLAAVGLAHEKEIDKGSKRVKEHFAYIKRNASSLCTTAVEDPELIQLMCDNRLIEERNIDKYIDAVGDAWCHILIMLNQDRDEKVLSILESYKSTLNEERICRENNKEKAAIEGKKKIIRERQAKRDPNSGINGLTFVLSGKMKSWRSRQELVDYLHFYGADLVDKVTEKVDYVVRCNCWSEEKESSAERLGIPIISEKQFQIMIAKQYEQSEHIIVPPWVKYIPKYTFWRTGYGDTILKSVVLPEGVERIEEAAFRSCSNLESITIPNSVRYLGRACFEFCSNLRAISLPDGLKCLEENLFYYCRALEKVRVPKSVIEISPKAFQNCPNVTIYTPNGSYAEQFANENGIPVVAEDSICD